MKCLVRTAFLLQKLSTGYLSGEEVLSEESVREFLQFLFSSLEKEKSLIVKLLLLSYSRQFFPDLQVHLTTDRSVRSVFMLCIFLFLLC